MLKGPLQKTETFKQNQAQNRAESQNCFRRGEVAHPETLILHHRWFHRHHCLHETHPGPAVEIGRIKIFVTSTPAYKTKNKMPLLSATAQQTPRAQNSGA
jgi:hypothetical protein